MGIVLNFSWGIFKFQGKLQMIMQNSRASREYFDHTIWNSIYTNLIPGYFNKLAAF